MSARQVVLGLIASIGLSTMLAAQGQAPVRDVQRTPTGTASISGVVMSDATPSRPVRRVLVSLGSGGVIKIPMSAITDDNGAFAFSNLPAGTYTLTASRPAYVSTAYRSTTPGRGSGVPISLAAGQQLTGIELKILHGSVIAGTLRDSTGKPFTDAEMVLLTVQTIGGRRKVTPVLQSARPDARGEFRLYGLAPGDYLVRAQPAPRLGSADLRPVTPAELEWSKQAAAAQANAAPGVTVDVPGAPGLGRPVTYAPTYFPGTADFTAATPISLGANEERLNIDFIAQAVPVASISGQVTGPDGQPPRNAVVTMQPIAPAGGASVIDAIIGMAIGASNVRVGSDGRLSGSGIPPGRYHLLVRGTPAANGPERPTPLVPAMPAGAAALAGMIAGVSGGAPMLWASTDLDIDGHDITGLDFRLQPGQSISGTVVFDGEDPQAPVDAQGVSISMNSASRDAKSALEMLAGMFQTSMGRANKDRTFSVAGLVPDIYRATFSPPGVISPLFSSANPGGWVLKSAMLDGRDLADVPLEIRSGEDLKGIVVTFTKTSAEISGRVQDANGQGVAGFPIVVFPADRALWVSGSRRIVSAKPASDGRYKVAGLPAGEYYLCALTDLDPNDLYDPAYLGQIVSGAFKLTLAEGEKKTQDLRLGGGL